MHDNQIKLKDMLSVVFKVPREKINDSTSPDTLAEWDSLKHLNMVLALEEQFDISISEEDAMQMISYELIVLTLREHGIEI